MFAAQVGIAGATVIEDNVILWGQVGVSKTLTIGKGAVLYAQSGVPASLEGGKNYFATGYRSEKKMKEIVWIKRIPELLGKIIGKKELIAGVIIIRQLISQVFPAPISLVDQSF